MTELSNKYNHKEIEEKWQSKWLNDQLYKWDENEKRENSFVIDTPPPTVSGILHMGHIFSYTQTDFVARYQRMKGKNVFYPMGFDDNGLPTERLVEKLKNIRGVNMDRNEFASTCKQVVKDAEEDFRSLFKSIALSVDWSQEYQTISDESRKISQMSFIDLYNKKRVYRKQEPVLWDIVDRTALAQADIEDKNIKGLMYDILFFTKDFKSLKIATTRPEMIPACVAIFCHPEDKRYSNIIGQTVLTPIFQQEVKIIADNKVDMEKGTGLVMCCTFGDTTDVEWWKTHDLNTKMIINENGRMRNFEQLENDKILTSEHAQIYKKIFDGNTIKQARENIVTTLKEMQLITAEQELERPVKCGERSGAPVEILITDQWFIKILDQKQELLKKANECNWHPSFMVKRMEAWIEGLNWDWCISRQRFFGVPFPVWYSKKKGEEGKLLIADVDSLPVDPIKDLPKGYSRDEVIADTDVMDTWATSSVSPQLNSKAINKDCSIDYGRHQKLFPADLRPQAHEIIRTWAFYTLVKAHFHENSIPWNNLMISGWVLAADKSKMSKSKGNVVTPVDLIKEKSADVIRYWASNSKLGMDIAYSEEIFKVGHKLVTKIWNASKFSCIHINKLKTIPKTIKEEVDNKVIFEAMDLWIITRLKNVINKATRKFEEFEYCDARNTVEEFFWKDFCDNYLEFVKVRAYDENETNSKGQLSAITTIYFCLKYIMKLFAPFLPHITEELYNNIFSHEGSIHNKHQWPDINDFSSENYFEQEGLAAINILDCIRLIKSEKQLSIKSPISLIKIFDGKIKASILEPIIADLSNVTNSKAIETISGNTQVAKNCVTTNSEMFSIEVIFEEITQ
jgi:valyl-tRNA synthetase